MCFECITLHHAAVLYISPAGRNIVTQGGWRTARDNVVYSSIRKYKCPKGLKEPFEGSERGGAVPPTPLQRCPLDPPASPDLLLLCRWLSPRFTEDHMLANGPPGWAAWRLEGSLVDPPISPGPRPRRSGARPAVPRAP